MSAPNKYTVQLQALREASQVLGRALSDEQRAEVLKRVQ